jgi:tetratricopeptide (TPR) repeat protein
MPTTAGRVFLATAACLFVLNGCETSSKVSDLFGSRAETTQSAPSRAEADMTPTGGLPTTAVDELHQPEGVPKGLLGKDPNDDLSLGKKYFRSGNFGLAERHFRRAVEQHPRDVESWIGLAASYDRLRRWDLADRAYDQALKIVGPTPEILNNIGYSLMLRGDYRRARETLLQAQAQDPGNPYVRNNLELLEASFRKGKAIQ